MSDQPAPSTVDLSDLAPVIAAWDQARSEMAKWEDLANALAAQIQARMGDATEATVAGQTAFTWRPAGPFAPRRFAAAWPEMAAAYTRPVPTLDTATLAREHPEVYARYRSRRFVRTGAPR